MNATRKGQEVHLFVDDTGSRQPDHVPAEERYDGMDCFGLGGVLVDREDLDRVWDAHQGFCNAWGITYPLHSYEIRGGRGNFSWLKNPERAVEFLPELEDVVKHATLTPRNYAISIGYSADQRPTTAPNNTLGLGLTVFMPVICPGLRRSRFGLHTPRIDECTF